MTAIRRTRYSTFLLLCLAAATSAQTLYKYRGENGEWIYSDRPPDDGDVTETRDLATGTVRGDITVSSEAIGGAVRLTASNRYFVPVQLKLEFSRITGLEFPHPDDDLTWVLPARSETDLLTLPLNGGVAPPEMRYRYEYLAGDPGAVHRPTEPYRVPYSAATGHFVTQAYPDVDTHRTPDSYHAIDIAMPIGTDIVAARDGLVFDVAESNFQSGLDPNRDGPAANVVRILHDDGTYAIYAHLNWNSIRVRPGNRIRRGEYIADSGNTGFSTGPHLHFAVVHNSPQGVVSVPVQFEGPNSSSVDAVSGAVLTAY